jgi:hypothetical protein
MHLANTLWPEFYQKHKGELVGKTGLYLLVFERQTSLLLGGVCGLFEDDKKGSVLHKTLEQKIREKSLIALKKIQCIDESGNHTSFPTTDREKGFFGGGIGVQDFIVGPAGLPAGLDHEFGLLVLKTADFCTQEEEEKIQKEFLEYNKKN